MLRCIYCPEAVFDAFIFGLMIQNLVAYMVSEEAKFMTHEDRKKYYFSLSAPSVFRAALLIDPCL